MSRNAAKVASSLWQPIEKPPIRLVRTEQPTALDLAQDNDGICLFKALCDDEVWQQRGNVLYKGAYLPRPDYIALMTEQLASSDEDQYAEGLREVRRQQEALAELKETAMPRTLPQETLDEFWELLEHLHDVWRFTPPSQVFWYGPLTGYPSGMVSGQEYLSRSQAALESGEAQRIEAVIVTMRRTLDPWKVIHGEK